MSTIDILMATYNGEKFITEQIKSIKAQTHKKWILFIRDDGSKDSTIPLIKAEIKGWENQIFLVDNKKEVEGIIGNFYELLKLSTSNYIVFSDQDDVWFEYKLERMIDKMKQQEEICGFNTPLLIHTNFIKTDSSLNILRKNFFKMYNPRKTSTKQLIVQNVVIGCTLMINRYVKELVVPFNKEILMHDWWMAVICSITGNIVYIKEPLMYYRQHDTNSVGISISLWGDLKKELKKFLFPQKYNKFIFVYKQAVSLRAHLKQHKISGKNIEIIDRFLNISKYHRFKRMLFLIIYGYVKYPFYRNLYLLSIKDSGW